MTSTVQVSNLTINPTYRFYNNSSYIICRAYSLINDVIASFRGYGGFTTQLFAESSLYLFVKFMYFLARSRVTLALFYLKTELIEHPDRISNKVTGKLVERTGTHKYTYYLIDSQYSEFFCLQLLS